MTTSTTSRVDLKAYFAVAEAIRKAGTINVIDLRMKSIKTIELDLFLGILGSLRAAGRIKTEGTDVLRWIGNKETK